MSVINTNYLSLVAQNNLQKSQSALGSAIERLSSGLRINSAKDDAAGQAIANRMTAQVKGLNQAQRNANDGISVAQTAEGALNQVNENLQRIRELAVQSRNGTNSQDDLNSIQAEIGQRLTEINRISDETDFNGVKVLQNDRALQIQVGANDDEVIEINLKEINAQTLNLGSFNVNGPKLDVGTMTVADALKAEFGATTEVATASIAADPTGAQWQSKLGLAAAPTAGVASVIADDDGNLFVKQTLTIANTATADIAKMKELGIGGTTGATDTTYDVYLAVDPKEGTVAATDIEFAVSLDNYTLTEIANGSTSDPLATLDAALSKVDTLRSDLGAIQNRFESAITNLQTNSTNLQAARSRIEDADYAVEVANMSKNQILQQAGTSVLAQANQIPQGVLSLLR